MTSSIPSPAAASINDLSSDVLKRILSGNPPEILGRWTRVSRQWLNVIHDHPTYWGGLTVLTSHPSSQRCFQSRILLSHDRPISVHVGEDAANPTVLTLIAEHMYHIQTLALRLPASHVSLALECLARRAPVLEHLDLEFICDDLSASPSLRHDLFLYTAPNLMHVRLVNAVLNEQSPPCFMSAENVTIGHYNRTTQIDAVTATFPSTINLTTIGACTNVSSVTEGTWPEYLETLTQHVLSTDALDETLTAPRSVAHMLHSWTIETNNPEIVRIISGRYIGSGALSLTVEHAHADLTWVTKGGRTRRFRFRTEHASQELLTKAVRDILQPAHATRITSLVIPVPFWDKLASILGDEFSQQRTTLSDLVSLTLVTESWDSALPTDGRNGFHTIPGPLQRFRTLTLQSYFPIEVNLKRLEQFVDLYLSDSSRPVDVVLDGVDPYIHYGVNYDRSIVNLVGEPEVHVRDREPETEPEYEFVDVDEMDETATDVEHV
ncbi:hypothetical protein BKA62DRAFT_718593 [Auriculariales sp. MPI-PUGE-AT-0066]|nr:hypothetical protein BKA62DRAFT_718593 [Auriculariales sp. MPI-PUGE-AT-0066]